MYKAGADYVGSLSIVAGQMLAKMTADCMGKRCRIDEDIMLYEGIEIEKHQVEKNSSLENKSIEDLDLERKIGCVIIGIERGKIVITSITKADNHKNRGYNCSCRTQASKFRNSRKNTLTEKW